MLLNTTLSLRLAGPADWPALQALLQANDLPLDGAEHHLSSCLLAESSGEVVGSAGMEVYGDIALVRSVAVALGRQGQGIGRHLLGHLIDAAKRRGITRLYLLTVTATAYFARFGFQPMKTQDAPSVLNASAEFQGACPASAVLMVLNLQET